MKKILFLLFLPLLGYSQTAETDWIKQYQTDYKNIVKDFYKILYDKKSINKNLSSFYWDAVLDTSMLKKIRPYTDELTCGLSKNELLSIIDDAEISDEGLQFSVYIKLSMTNGKHIYFELGSKDLPSIIQNIWLSDGVLFSSIIQNEIPVQKLLLVGASNEKEGYTIVRKNPSNSSDVVDRFTIKEYFYYVPNSTNDWWLVARKDDTRAILGYVNKNQIMKYSEMPNEVKMHARKDR